MVIYFQHTAQSVCCLTAPGSSASVLGMNAHNLPAYLTSSPVQGRTVITIPPSSTNNRLLRSFTDTHREVMKMFPQWSDAEKESNAHRILFRVQDGATPLHRALVVISPMKPNVSAAGFEGAQVAVPFEPMSADHDKGSRVMVAARLVTEKRPTLYVTKSGELSHQKADAVLGSNGKPKRVQQTRPVKENELAAWLGSLCEQHGMRLLNARFVSEVDGELVEDFIPLIESKGGYTWTSEKQEFTQMRKHAQNKGVRSYHSRDLLFAVEVTDKDAFFSARQFGIGRGRAFGYGSIEVSDSVDLGEDFV